MDSSVLVMIIIATQIIAESLPISSSGHMLLVEKLTETFGFGALPVLPEFFDHFLHGPTIIVLLVYFWHAWSEPLGFLFTGIKTRDSWHKLYKIFLKIIGLITITDGITVIFYYLIKKQVSKVIMLDNTKLLLLGFIITTGLLLSLRFLKQIQERAGYKTLSSQSALILGIVQGLTLLTGISRFASTYVIARWLGISHRRAFQFSFLVLFPLIIAGFFVNGLVQVFTSDIVRDIITVPMIIVFTGSTIIAFYALKLADYMGARQKLWWFGVYMFVPVFITCMLIFSGH